MASPRGLGSGQNNHKQSNSRTQSALSGRKRSKTAGTAEVPRIPSSSSRRSSCPPEIYYHSLSEICRSCYHRSSIYHECCMRPWKYRCTIYLGPAAWYNRSRRRSCSGRNGLHGTRLRRLHHSWLAGTPWTGASQSNGGVLLRAAIICTLNSSCFEVQYHVCKEFPIQFLLAIIF